MDFSFLRQELIESLHGIEMEGLRVDSLGKLSLTPHPTEFGSKLTDPYISTDFSESQLEMISPPFQDAHMAYLFITDLQKYIVSHVKDVLWPYSGPCILPEEKEIPIADFGPSKKGKQKTLYRIGLATRYGKKMQMLSGVHYNFSFSKNFWKKLYRKTDQKLSLQEFISECYLKMIRNFLRMGWICTYLFGVTPALDQSYFSRVKKPMRKWKRRTYYAPYATSLRMSRFGYMNKTECQQPVSFNRLAEYLADLQHHLKTPHPRFRKLKGPQMNPNIFQIEAEHYSRIRPKPRPHHTHLEGIQKGIEYLEIRNMDISPFCESGLEMNELYFLQSFLLFALGAKDESLTNQEQKEICENQNLVALHGRDPKVRLQRKGKSILLRTWAKEMINQIRPYADTWDKAWKTKSYKKSLREQEKKISDPEKTPSSMLLKELQKKDQELYDYILQKAKKRFT